MCICIQLLVMSSVHSYYMYICMLAISTGIDLYKVGILVYAIVPLCTIQYEI